METTNIPSFESLDLADDQRSNKIFSSILKTLLVNGNRYMTAKEIVEGIHEHGFTRLGGLTPQATVQGNISTAISTALSKKRPTPIEKRKVESNGIGYRIAKGLFPPDSEILSLMELDPPDPPGNNKKKPPVKKSQAKSSRVTASRNKTKRQTSKITTRAKSRNGLPKKRSSQKYTNIQTVVDYSSESDSDSSEERISKKRGTKLRTSNDSSSTDSDSEITEDLSSAQTPQEPNVGLNEIDAHNSSFLTINEPSDFGIDHSIGPVSFAIAQETGYSYPRFRSSPRMRYAKAKCEDAFCVRDLYYVNGSFLGRLFCLADGHGGSGCSAFLTSRVPDCVESMLRLYEPTQLEDDHIQENFKRDMTVLIRRLDDEYLNAKREEYRHWQAHDDLVAPIDDGATLVINLFFGEWFININVGDSRTILASKVNEKWTVDFASEDHKPFLERLAVQIFSNGGLFVDSQDKPIRFDPSPQDRPIRTNLKSARIRLQNADNDLGVPYKNNNGNNWSLNVAATCGDLLFKLDPSKPVINCVPDIYFNKLGAFSKRTGTKLDSGEHIKNIAMHLCNREGDRSLFENTLQEYDD
ncbi:9808_t:CDS:2, partial [Acaulospora morrowiae]